MLPDNLEEEDYYEELNEEMMDDSVQVNERKKRTKAAKEVGRSFEWYRNNENRC